VGVTDRMVARESAVPIMMAERHAREANMARTRDGCTLRAGGGRCATSRRGARRSAGPRAGAGGVGLGADGCPGDSRSRQSISCTSLAPNTCQRRVASHAAPPPRRPAAPPRRRRGVGRGARRLLRVRQRDELRALGHGRLAVNPQLESVRPAGPTGGACVSARGGRTGRGAQRSTRRGLRRPGGARIRATRLLGAGGELGCVRFVLRRGKGRNVSS
jgi:hypothetical protein